MTNFLKEKLNNEQYIAVTAPDGPIMVTAGAGSGKTRVLTYRILHLIKERNIDPYNILAVTFTNKAVEEMRERIEGFDVDTSFLTISTFHSFGLKVIRYNIDHVENLEKDFTIIDQNDQRRTLRTILKDHGIDSKSKALTHYSRIIKRVKNTPGYITDNKLPGFLKDMDVEIFQTYYSVLKESNSIDFQDLLILPYRLLKQNEDVKQYYHRRYNYIHIDEYQDTNNMQYLLIRELLNENKNIFVVGDEDQGIYGFRGANIENITKFKRDFPKTKTFKLERNYRSTKNILDIANKLIQYNINRVDKILYTENLRGTKTTLYLCESDYDEVRYIIDEINRKVAYDKVDYSDFTILLRTNAQTRLYEKLFIQSGLPYILVGNIRFFERQEIKDIMAYLTLLVNQNNQIALRRVINLPKRGIGQKSVHKLFVFSKDNNIPIYKLLQNIEKYDIFSKRVSSRILEFIGLIDTARKELNNNISLSNFVEDYMQDIGYVEYLKSNQETSRVENVSEFIRSIIEYENNIEDNIDNNEDKLIDYLEKITLMSEIDRNDINHSAVKIMTVHNAKGLEFPIVFIGGLVEGLFPHHLSVNDENRKDVDSDETLYEEERRLFYVAITRAQKELYVSGYNKRYMFGQIHYSKPSSFIDEIGRENFNVIDNTDTIPVKTRDFSHKRSVPTSFSGSRKFIKIFRDTESFDNIASFDDNKEYDIDEVQRVRKKLGLNKTKGILGLHIGDRVCHKIFGEGSVLSFDTEKDSVRIEVDFDDAGTKLLSMNHTSLEKVK